VRLESSTRGSLFSWALTDGRLLEGRQNTGWTTVISKSLGVYQPLSTPQIFPSQTTQSWTRINKQNISTQVTHLTIHKSSLELFILPTQVWRDLGQSV